MIWFFTLWFALLILGMPLAFTLIVPSVLYLVVTGHGLDFAAQRMIGGLNSFPLLAVPFFILTAQLMNTSGVSERIFGFARTLVGHVKGGLGHVNVLASLLFSGMSGSAVADAGGLGQLEVKAMRDGGYDDDFSGSVTAASAIIGPLIPPSIPFVVYGVVANASIGGLFLGGIGPGLLSTAVMMGVVYVIASRRGYPTDARASWSETGAAFLRALLPLLTPGIIIGGIFGGWFSPTEASVVAATYALILGLFMYREIGPAGMVQVLRETVNNTAAIGLIVAGVSLFGYVIALEQVPQKISTFFLGLSDDPLVFLLIVNLMLLILGTFIEALAILLLVVPVLVPVALKLGIDPIHFGVLTIFNLMIGILTPPMGVALFVVAKVTKIPFVVLARGIVPFVIPLIGVLILMIFFPPIVTAIPHFFLGSGQ
jgi:tripartite ATP-independent transporter DctM subunit